MKRFIGPDTHTHTPIGTVSQSIFKEDVCSILSLLSGDFLSILSCQPPPLLHPSPARSLALALSRWSSLTKKVWNRLRVGRQNRGLAEIQVCLELQQNRAVPALGLTQGGREGVREGKREGRGRVCSSCNNLHLKELCCCFFSPQSWN